MMPKSNYREMRFISSLGGKFPSIAVFVTVTIANNQ
ncbi:Uncharacterised protein [Streptococcus pneumoniae]|nr:Uncharacterised protein [Streptococcus pneumoniae]